MIKFVFMELAKRNSIMKFRQHKGGLKESLATEKEFSTFEDFSTYLKSLAYQGLNIKEIKFNYISFDSRTNWDTYYVSVRYDGFENFELIGMSDGLLE